MKNIKNKTKKLAIKSIPFICFILVSAYLLDYVLIKVYLSGYELFPSYEVIKIEVPRKNVSNPTETIQILDTSEKKPVSVKDQIIAIAKEKNFKWPEYLVRLAVCESRLNPKAINVNSNGTADKGLFQINDVHKIPDHLRYDVRWSTEWTINKINEGGQRIWVCNSYVLENPQKYEQIAKNL